MSPEDPGQKVLQAVDDRPREGMIFLEPPELEDSLGLALKIDRVLREEKTPFQELVVAQCGPLGRVLLLDGCIQLTELDEPAYHEMLAHVPLLSHPEPKTVLIVGGGDGGTLREALKHPEVERVDLCEIDSQVIRAAQDFFPRQAQAFEHPKARLVIDDGFAFVARNPGAYDVILVDSSDPEGPAARLFGREFYQSLNRALKPGGVLATQAESFHFYLPLIQHIFSFARPLFKTCGYYHTLVPSYIGGHIGFTFLSQGPEPLAPPDETRLANLGRLAYYTPDVHRAAFALPAAVERALAAS